MAGYVTSRRDRSSRLKATTRSDDGSFFLEAAIKVPDFQETYSFRSGSRGPSDEETLQQDSNIYVRGPVGSSFDTGHEFYTRRSRYTGTSQPQFTYRTSSGLTYDGPLIISEPGELSGKMPLMPPLTLSEKNVYGARAINSTIPTRPDAGLAQLLGELKRDGLPAIPGLQIFSPNANLRSLGSEYLNVEFGLKPLFNDLRSLFETVKNSSRTVEQMRRDSGRVVRRRFSFPVENAVIERKLNIPSHLYTLEGIPSALFHRKSSRIVTVTDTTSRRIWFSGAFSYYLDMGDDLISRFTRYEQLANKLLGTRLTPGVLYDLAPWSWLIDWFADVGIVLNNASMLQSDGLVIRHGYLMCHTMTRRTMRTEPQFVGMGSPFTVSNSFLGERKERFRSTPYGFGLTEESFTTRQWAILAALGMTRAPNRMM